MRFSTRAQGNAYGDVASALPSDASTPAVEFNAGEYDAIKADDGEYAVQRFRFKAPSNAEAEVAGLSVTWVGTGWHDASTNGADLYI